MLEALPAAYIKGGALLHAEGHPLPAAYIKGGALLHAEGHRMREDIEDSREHRARVSSRESSSSSSTV